MKRRRDKNKKPRIPAKNRPDVRGDSGLFDCIPGLVDMAASPDDLASAFIGRWRECSDSYSSIIMPYFNVSLKDNIAWTLRMVKDRYKRFVCEVGWTEEKFFRVSAWALENNKPLSIEFYVEGGRRYDSNTLPWGNIVKMKTRDYKYIVGLTNGR